MQEERLLGGLWGAVVGDALGVPVEFWSRQSLHRDPVTDLRGEGTHGQPSGTWSDDSSLMLCTIEGLMGDFDSQTMGDLFVRWLNEAYWTPWGRVFDVGGTTAGAIHNLADGMALEQAGLDNVDSNGNGSLMRILPVALRFLKSPPELVLDYAHRASSLTHRHPRSQIACGFYCAVVISLMEGLEPKEAYDRAIVETYSYYQQSIFSAELTHFSRIFSGTIGDLTQEEIKSSGYVIHTLEASLWCLFTTRSYEEAVLAAVNLGEDTDTTGIVTGGLAGVHYGLGQVPVRWREQLARWEEIATLFGSFQRVVCSGRH